VTLYNEFNKSQFETIIIGIKTFAEGVLLNVSETILFLFS